MKKLLISLAVLAGILIFCTPYVTGKVAESEVRKLIGLLNQSPVEYGNTEVVSYKRSFRSTESRFRYTLPGMYSDFVGIDPIDYICISKHGILGVTFECKLIDNEAYNEFIDTYLGGKDPISISGAASIFGGLEQTISLNAIQDFQANDGIYNLADSEITVHTNSEFSDLDISGKSGGASIAEGTTLFSLGETSLAANLRKSDSGLYVGNTQFTIANLASKSGNQTIDLNEITLKTNTNENSENLDSSMIMQIEQISTLAAPFESIKNLKVEVAVNGINTAAFVEYQNFAERLQKDLLASIESEQQPDFDQKIGLEAIPILEKMLSEDLELDSAMSVQLDNEPSSASLKVNLLETVTFDDLKELTSAPEQILEKFDIRLQASLAKTLVDSQAVLARSISQSSLFELSKNDYQAKLSLGKEIKLNGRKVTLEELQILLMTPPAAI